MKRQLAILTTVAVVAIGWMLWKQEAPPSPSPEAKTKLPNWAENKKMVQLEITKTIVANIADDKETESQYRRYLDLFRTSRQSLFAEDERDIFLSQAARSKAILEFTKLLLESPTQAKAILGNDQAEARMLAIQVLRKNAQLEGPTELEGVLSKVSQRLLRDSNASAGEKRDLEDLIANYTSLKPEESYRNIDGLLKKIAFNKSLRPQIVTGIYLGLKNRYSKEEIETLLSNHHLLERSN